jgi:hypothetical protein
MSLFTRCSFRLFHVYSEKPVIERCSLISALGLTSAPDTYGLANESAGFLLSMKCLVPEMGREEKKCPIWKSYSETGLDKGCLGRERRDICVTYICQKKEI